MPEPNPLLGVHAGPGAVAWAQVRREPDGALRVLAWGVESAPEDPVAAVDAALAVVHRKPFRGRGAFVALPDVSGCLVTAELPPDEADLAGEDLRRELHEHTPFEPQAGVLRHRLVREDGRRREFLVAAIPAPQEQRFRAAAMARDDGATGLGLGGAALVRGLAAMGLAGPPGFAVEVLPHATHVYAFDGPRARRYLVPAGAADVIREAAQAAGRAPDEASRAVAAGAVDVTLAGALAAAAEPLAEDVRLAAAYHVAQRYLPKDPPADLPAPRFFATGALLGRAPLRAALAAHLGDSFLAEPSPGDGRANVAWDRDPGADRATLAGALGAAVEAFAPAAERIALVAPPADVAPPRASRAPLWAAAVLVAGVAGFAAWQATRPATQAVVSGARAATVAATPDVSPALLADVQAACSVAAWLDALATAEPVLEIADAGFDTVEIERVASAAMTAAHRVTLSAPRTPESEAAAHKAADVLGSTPGVEVPETSAGEKSVRVAWTARSAAAEELAAHLARRHGEALRAALVAWRTAAQARRDVDGVPTGAREQWTWTTDDVLAALATGAGGHAPGRAVARRTPRGLVVQTGPGDWYPRPAAPDAPSDPRAAADAVAHRLVAPLPSGRLAASAPAAPKAEVSPLDPASASLSWGDGGPRVLRRLDPGATEWIDVATVAPGPGSRVDWPEAGPGEYRWRLDRPDAPTGGEGRAAALRLAPVVTASPLSLEKDGAVRFRLARNWRSVVVEAEVVVAPGAPVASSAAAPGTGQKLSLDTGLRLASARIETSEDAVRRWVPSFGPDGRVVRTPDGSAPRAEREVRTPVRTLHADLAGEPGAPVVRVSRKMTDG